MGARVLCQLREARIEQGVVVVLGRRDMCSCGDLEDIVGEEDLRAAEDRFDAR